MKFKFGEEVEIRDGFFDDEKGYVIDYDKNSDNVMEYQVAIYADTKKEKYVTNKWLPESKLKKKNAKNTKKAK